MKFSIRIIIMLLCVASLSVNAQEVLYSHYDKFDYRSDEYAVVGITGDKLYTYRYDPDGAVLDAYDDSMNKVATVMLDFFPSKIYNAKFIAYPDKIIVLYQALESNKVIQYAALLDDKGRLTGKPIELGSVKTGIFGATKTYFSSAIAENKKTILIYSANDRGKQIDFDGKWLDDKLRIVKRSKAVFKSDNSVEHGEVCMSNDGVVYMVAYTPVGTQNYADQFWILTLGQGATKFDPKELVLDEKFAANGYMKIDNVNNHVYFGGFYSDKKSGNFNGVIYADLDIARGTYQSKRLIPFDPKLLAAVGAKQKGSMDFYQARQLIVRNDGGFVLISEIQYISTRSNYTPGFGYYAFYSPYMSSMVHEYHYNDIMALCYNKDGVREWSSFIPKEQYSQEDGGVFSSYVLLNTGGALAFLFNDFNIHHSRIQLATLTAEGKTEMHPFAPEGNDNPDWLPRSGKQVSSTELVVPCFKKKQICFARVTF